MIDVLVPEEQEGTKAVVRAWLKQVGDRVEENDPLVELETDKVAMEVPAPAAGVLREILLHSNEDAVPGAILGRIAPAVEIGEVEREPVRAEPARPSRTPQHDARPARSDSPERETRLSPSVKRAVLQHDLDPARIEGTGRAGRITRADVDRAVEQSTRVQKPVEGVIPAAAAVGDIRSHFVPHDNMRLRIAENMHASVTQAPHVTAVFEADFSAIMAHRDAHKAAWSKKGVKLTYTAYLVAAAAEAMKVGAGDQQPLARRQARALRRRQYRRRHRARHQGADRAGAARGAEAVAEGHRVGPRRSDRAGARREADRADVAAAPSPSRTTASRARCSPRRSSSTSRNRRSSESASSRRASSCARSAAVDAIQIRPMAYVSLTIDHRVVDGHQTTCLAERFVELLESWPDE
jgi:2-oxoglutarate dehydrogenase E2 component (dihydrolipoamide succinyltransferase)